MNTRTSKHINQRQLRNSLCFLSRRFAVNRRQNGGKIRGTCREHVNWVIEGQWAVVLALELSWQWKFNHPKLVRKTNTPSGGIRINCSRYNRVRVWGKLGLAETRYLSRSLCCWLLQVEFLSSPGPFLLSFQLEVKLFLNPDSDFLTCKLVLHFGLFQNKQGFQIFSRTNIEKTHQNQCQ